jgi:hypothetical protein
VAKDVGDDEALARTVLLITNDVFNKVRGEDPGLERDILAGLRATTIRIVADDLNLSSHSGQSCVVALAGLIAMMGIRVTLDLSNVRLLHAQPPLRGTHIVDALEEYASDMVPGTVMGGPHSPDDLVIVIGSSPFDGDNHFTLTGTDWSFELSCQPRGIPWTSEIAIGALAGAAAAAAEAFRAALGVISATSGIPLPAQSRNHVDFNRVVLVDLGHPLLQTDVIDVGIVDVVSAGAITSATLYCLRRLVGIRGRLRVTDQDLFELSNMNRYMLSRRSDLERNKAELLGGYATQNMKIVAVPEQFSDEWVQKNGPLAPTVLVGVDHIPSRWAVQRAQPVWCCVGATSHLWPVLVSTHRDGEPCVGCAHPTDSEGDGEIPTISFVSFWAGILQVRALLLRSIGATPESPQVLAAPAGLYGDHGVSMLGLPPNEHCPIECRASKVTTSHSMREVDATKSACIDSA